MRSKPFLVACLILVNTVAVSADEETYRVQKGDTLWDLSDRFWNDARTWPELWALNPHFRNPHIIAPGDPIFLKRPVPEELTVHLPLLRLEPEVGPGGPKPGTEPTSIAGATGAAAEKGLPGVVSLAGKGSQDFVSSHRIPRLGTVANRRQQKVAYAAGEDVEIGLSGDGVLKPGDLATLFDDTAALVHPVSGRPEGYHVRVLGQARIRSISSRKAVARLLETCDTIEDGMGVMEYRAAITQVVPRIAKVAVEGILLPSGQEKTLFAADDVVFLDRGSIHGLEPGVLLEVPVPEEPRAAQGMVDLVRPMARLVVLSVADKTAAGVVLDSRATISAGDRFVVAAFSP